MKFGLATSGTTDPLLLEKMAILADEMGYDCFLVTDHFMGRGKTGSLDAWTFLPYIAAKTKKIRLGTCVTPLTFRPPAILAKMVATSDVLSKGRIILGAGAGWYKPEFEAFSKWLEPSERVEFTRESLELLTRLWTSEVPIDYEGRFIVSHGALINPKPVQKPHPPIWFGSTSNKMLRLAGRFGLGWIPVGPRWIDADYPNPQKYSELRKVIVAELQKRNIDEKEFVFSILINVSDTETLRKDIESYAKAGMNYFILGMARQSNESESLANIERAAMEIGQQLV
jgi:alkanesulfonate monooxygenase SsuD/methylene tetrahydromethanopterin reductase-like flavin-dependent oxidoreductase (luciferase family)